LPLQTAPLTLQPALGSAQTELRSDPATPRRAFRLRILLVLEPGVDGAFRYVELLARFLIAKGHEVHLAYSDRRGSVALNHLVEYVRAQGGQCYNLRVSNAPQLGDLRALWGLRQLARRTGVDVIHCHSSKAGALGRVLAWLGIRAKFFYTPHAYYGLDGRKGPRIAMFNFIEWILGKTGRTVNISKDELRFAVERLDVPPHRCCVINNPVDCSSFLPPTAEERKSAREKLGLPEGAVILGSMGRLSAQKDPQTLYQAFAMARQRGADIYLLHVGRGDLEQEVSELAGRLQIKDRITRVPYLERPLDFYSAVDALIMTSRYEGFWPMVILEALACDLPIISGTGPGTSDIGLAALSHCWTASVGNVPGFAQAIEQWYHDRKSNRFRNHREVALGRFNQERSFGSLVELYSSDL
jgi:glycosyltransferase involved in cell wall biosynthesis